MADEKEKPDRAGREEARREEACGEEACHREEACGEGRTRTKTAAKPRARKPAAAKAEAKAEAEACGAPPSRREEAGRRERAGAKAEAPKAETAKAKPAARKREAPQRPLVRAQAKYVRSSARKARLVMDHVRGRPVAEARALLRHSPRGVARDVERLLNSAIANAENNHELVGDDLYVKEIYADEGPTLRRFRPRAQGRATRIRKRTSHLTVALSTKE